MAASRTNSPRMSKKKPAPAPEPEKAPAMSPRIVREVAAVLWLGAALLTLLSLISYDTNDLGMFSTQPNDPPFNFIGITGAYWSMALFMSLGVAGYLVPLLFFATGIAMLMHPGFLWRWKLPWSAVFLVSAACLMHVHGWMADWTQQVNAVSSGGFIGQWIDDYIMVALLGPVGAKIVLWMLYVASVLFLFELNPRTAWEALIAWWKDYQHRRREARIGNDPIARALAEKEDLDRKRRELERELKRMAKENGIEDPAETAATSVLEPAEPAPVDVEEPFEPPQVIDASQPRKGKKSKPEPEPEPDETAAPTDTPEEEEAPAPVAEKATSPRKKAAGGTLGKTPRESVRHAGEADAATGPLFADYQLPAFDLLEENTATGDSGMNESELRGNSELLIRTLAEFGIKAQPGPITKGATITRYEVIPATGVRVDKIKSLHRDISRVMKAERVNILAPIPGKDSVGVEVPNTKKVPIVLHDLMESDTWKSNKAKIPIALGKDVYGQTLIADLAEMPHLLIAGTTGSGKSVCINALLMSLMYKFTPDELRLILVDPKQVEMQIYNTVPHLVVPVVTEPKKVLMALRWVIQEMEQRYRILAKVGVRNISSFNKRKREEPKKPEEEADGENGENAAAETEPELPIRVPREDDLHIPDKLPYIVVIIDELADLMQTAPADVESGIARLTAKARAAGIHLVVATQTPRREVITGVIKTNIPSRVAFQVPSALDSRVILDENGAENLLGKGDLLYLPPGSSKLVRGQGAFVSDEEVQAVVDFCAAQATPDFDEGIQKKLDGDSGAINDVSEDDLDLLHKCLEVVRQEKKASTSMLQRRLRLGYNRAAWVMDKFQELGIISPPDPDNPARPREFLVDLDSYELPGG